MDSRIKEYSVGELARLAKISIRTLHHYDAIGLLPPAHVALNGYRTYGVAQLFRLQEILFYRAIGMGLGEISEVLAEGKDAVGRLVSHRTLLADKARQAAEMLVTLDKTIAHLKGEAEMAHDDLYKPFPTEKQAEYESWLAKTYGDGMAERIAMAKDSAKELPGGIAESMKDLRAIEAEFVKLLEGGISEQDRLSHQAMERHRTLMSKMWGRECNADGFEGLAGMYESHEDFIARYEQLSPRLSKWLPDAMRNHAERLRKTAS